MLWDTLFSMKKVFDKSRGSVLKRGSTQIPSSGCLANLIYIIILFSILSMFCAGFLFFHANAAPSAVSVLVTFARRAGSSMRSLCPTSFRNLLCARTPVRNSTKSAVTSMASAPSLRFFSRSLLSMLKSSCVSLTCANSVLADYFDVSLDYLVGRSDDPARRWKSF